MNCTYCKKPCNDWMNYCGWECMKAEATAAGGRQHQPNGLPICSIKYDGEMYEHEHGDHPDYQFPVTVTYVLPRPELPEWDHSYEPQDHALIYSDGSIALTMYECCYTLWHLRDGSYIGGFSKDYRLTEESLEKIRGHNEQRTS